MSQTIPPILSVSPSRALVDEKFQVLVENLPPGSPVTLHSLHCSEDRDYWESYGHYISDHKGIVSGEFPSFVSLFLNWIVWILELHHALELICQLDFSSFLLAFYCVCSCRRFEFWGHIHRKRSYGFVVEYAPCARKSQRPQVMDYTCVMLHISQHCHATCQEIQGVSWLPVCLSWDAHHFLFVTWGLPKASAAQAVHFLTNCCTESPQRLHWNPDWPFHRIGWTEMGRDVLRLWCEACCPFFTCQAEKDERL